MTWSPLIDRERCYWNIYKDWTGKKISNINTFTIVHVIMQATETWFLWNCFPVEHIWGIMLNFAKRYDNWYKSFNKYKQWQHKRKRMKKSKGCICAGSYNCFLYSLIYIPTHYWLQFSSIKLQWLSTVRILGFRKKVSACFRNLFIRV